MLFSENNKIHTVHFYPFFYYLGGILLQYFVVDFRDSRNFLAFFLVTR